MTMPQPPYQQYPQQPQPWVDGYQQPYPQGPQQPYYPQSGYVPGYQPSGQFPLAGSVPTQRGLPPAPPQPPRKPRFGLLARIGMIIGAAVLIVIVASVASAAKSSRSSTPPSTAGSTTTTYAAPTPAAVAPTVAPSVPAAPAKPAPAKAITARDWAKIAKSPDAHVGESIVVYGQVKQFDAATGTDGFRANVDGVKHPVSYGYADYETNTVLASASADLSDLVEGDLFRAEVVVSGSVSYETTLGGTMTAPQLNITKITTIGTAK